MSTSVRARPRSGGGADGARLSVMARRRAITGALLTVPALVPVIVFAIIPIFFAIYISLTDWPLFGDVTFIGFENYAALAGNADFWYAIAFTSLYTAIVTVPILLLGYLLTLLVRNKRRGAVFLRTVFFLPYVVGLATLSFLMLVELQPNSGLINVFLKGIGLTDGATAWFLRADSGLLIVSVLVIWFAGGLTMVLLLGGMQAVPDEVYEAAEIDGANAFQRELLITIPLIKRNIAMSLVLSVIGSFLAFQQFVILTNGGPGRETTTLVMLVYQEAFISGRIGSATAMGIVIMIVIAALTSVQLFALREKD